MTRENFEKKMLGRMKDDLAKKADVDVNVSSAVSIAAERAIAEYITIELYRTAVYEKDADELFGGLTDELCVALMTEYEFGECIRDGVIKSAVPLIKDVIRDCLKSELVNQAESCRNRLTIEV